MKIMKILPWVAGIGVVVACLSLSARGQELKVGQNAPDFSLQGSDGKTYTLSQFKGKKAVVIAWFPKANTSVCTAECKSLRDSAKTIEDFDVVFFAASVDKPETNRKFAQSLELPYPILSDPSCKTAKAFGVLGMLPFANRWTFYIDKEGKVALIDKAIRAASAGEDLKKHLEYLRVPRHGK